MIVDINNIGKRIDKYLCDNTEYTRSKIQKMIDFVKEANEIS